MEGGIVGGEAGSSGAAEEGSSGGIEAGIEGAGRVRIGVLFVGPGLIKVVMSSGVFAGVTLSMNCQDGSSKTMELWSEWSGMGMLEADSMSFCAWSFD